MSEFEQARLGSLCDFTQGVQIADKDTIKQPKDGYVRYIYIRDLFTDKFPVYVKDVYPNKLLLNGDIVMVNTGNTSGSVYQAKEGVLCNNAFKIAVKSSKLNKLDKGFLWVYLNSDARERMLKRLFNPAGQPHVGHKNVARLDISLPPLPEQRKIAKILATWDKAISTTERLIDNSKQQKKALMQQLLTGKKRLLDESGKPFEGEWEEVKLGQITEFIKDGTHGTHKRYETGVPMLSAANITKNHKICFEGAPFISEVDYQKIHAKYEISVGDVLLTVVGTLGRVAIVEKKERFTLQRSVAIIRASDAVDNRFLMQLFSSNDFNHLLVRKSNSTAQAGVYLGELAKIKIFLPAIEEQQKIASVLVNADKEIELLEHQLADLKQEKKALMQQLLTGKRRVKVNDGAAA